ncbi:MAG TPA: cysteine desulfurase family protein [Acidimicrobiales bacterium]|nr:cysteine desulfurase family protein [Acidimicrobiales bacterium]
MRAYLDHASTTPMVPGAVEAMMPYLTGGAGNPSGAHDESRQARRAVDEAREQLASSLAVGPTDLVFTGGGTEADNLAIVGGWEAVAASDSWSGPGPPAMVCSAMEHHAVLNTCRALAHRTGARLTEVPTSKEGIVDLEALGEACTSEVGLVSVMTVNNEVGTVQPIEHVAEVVRNGSPSAVLHTDAVQAVPWIDVRARTAPADLVAISAHKFGGPMGVGALLVRHGVRLHPLVHGGGQERGRRSGTHNVAGIAGMAAALAEIDPVRPETVERVAAQRDRLGDGLMATVTGLTETTARDQKVAGILHLLVAGIESEALVVVLDAAGVAASAGAACSSGAVEASHVLRSMGLGRELAVAGIRLSLGSGTTDADIDHVLSVVPGVVAQLRD